MPPVRPARRVLQGPAGRGPTGATGATGPQGPAGSIGATAIRTLTGSANVLDTDFTLICAVNNGITLTMTLPTPDASNLGRIYLFKRTMPNNQGTCRIVSTAGTIDGLASKDLTQPSGNSANSPSAVWVQSSGAGGSWWIIAIAP